MKVAFVKQQLDTYGPWCSLRYADTGPEALFDVWPGKAALWHATVHLQADWYVIPQQMNTEYTYDGVLNGTNQSDVLMRHTRNVVQPTEIPFSDYDVVIMNDPIVRPPRGLKTVFAYYMNEDWDILYYRSMLRVLPGYDLFLAHMADGPQEVRTLPQALAFPYVWERRILEKTFCGGEKEDVVWADYRTVTLLAGADVTQESLHEAVVRFQRMLGRPVKHRPFKKGLYQPADPPLWGDARGYFAEMAACRYYVGVGRSRGGGQSLVDAAALGAICFGDRDRPYHRMLCHPACLCDDLGDLPRRFRAVTQSADLCAEVSAWQYEQLQRRFIDGPTEQLRIASDMKRTKRAR